MTSSPILLARICGVVFVALIASVSTRSALAACPNPFTAKDAAAASQNLATQNDANNNCVFESAAYQAVQFNATLQSAAVANGNGTVLSVTGLAGATVTVNCASCSGGTTVNFEAQEDGSNFVPIEGSKLDGTTLATTTTTAGVTVWQFNLPGVQQIRARISGYSAGTVTVTAHAISVAQHFPNVGAQQVTSPWVTNINQIGGSALAFGQGTMAASLPVAVASNQSALPATQSGTWTMQPGNTANTTPWLAQPVPGTAGGCTPYHLANGSAATTNATFIKASPGNLCDIDVINTTSVTYFLKLYDLAAAPTCSSATGLKHVFPIPNNTGIGAGIIRSLALGETYTTGIAFCLTGGGADTDNTNAATGVWIEASYK